MLKHIKVIGILMLLTSLAGGLHASDLRFEQALELLKINNGALLAAKAEEQTAEYTKKAARGLYLPKIGLEGKYTRIDEPLVIDLNGIRSVIVKLHAGTPGIESAVPSFETTVQEETFFKSNINFTWPVFTGGKILAVNRAAEAKIAESKEKTRSVHASLTAELVKRYYGVRLGQRVVEVRKQVLDSMNEHLVQAKKLQESGMIALSEKLHAEVTWAEADREHKKALRQLAITQAALNSILSSGEDIHPVSGMFINRTIGDMAGFLKSAETKNPLLKQIAAKRDQANQGYNIEKSAFYPTLYLFGKRELYKDDLTMLEPEWAVGIGFSVNLFSGFSSFNSLKAAKQQEAQVGFLEVDAQRKINTLVEKKYNELMLSLEQYQATESSFKFANEYVRVRKKAFKAGMTTSINVVDSELALSRVKIDKLKAAYRFDVALAELLEASGNIEQFETYRNHENAEEIH
jgi:outer membrane protein TolC